jgi:hypothetical protein
VRHSHCTMFKEPQFTDFKIILGEIHGLSINVSYSILVLILKVVFLLTGIDATSEKLIFQGKILLNLQSTHFSCSCILG